MERVSVLIASKRGPKFLRAALNSLLHQTYSNWEALIVSSGGPGVASMCEGLRDERIICISGTEDHGECGGRNLAATRSTGSLLCYLDDDDILPSSSLAARVQFLERHPHCGMVYAEQRRVHWRDRRWCDADESATPAYHQKRYYDALLERVGYASDQTHGLLKWFNFVRGGTPMLRRDVFEAVGGFDTRFQLYGDYDMWLQVASRFPIRFLNHAAYIYRLHPTSTSERLRATRTEKRAALLLCRKHEIRRSVQFAHHQHDIDRMWSNSESQGPSGSRVQT